MLSLTLSQISFMLRHFLSNPTQHFPGNYSFIQIYQIRGIELYFSTFPIVNI